jgi:hypothetical protein
MFAPIVFSRVDCNAVPPPGTSAVFKEKNPRSAALLCTRKSPPQATTRPLRRAVAVERRLMVSNPLPMPVEAAADERTALGMINSDCSFRPWAEADHAKADQVRMARDVSVMFDELKALADKHAALHADQMRLQAELEQALLRI